MARICPTCGYENRDDAAFCGMCKALFQKKPARAGAAKASSPTPRTPEAATRSGAPRPPAAPTPAATSLDYPAIARSFAERHDPMLESFGLRRDRSLASIRVLDAFIDEMWGTAGDSPDSDEYRPSPGKANLVIAFGAYLGEVIRDQLGGAWADDSATPPSPVNARLIVGEMTAFPIARIYKRFKNGSSEPLFQFAHYVIRELAPARLPGCAADFERHAHRLLDESHLPDDRKAAIAVELLRTAASLDPSQQPRLAPEIARLAAAATAPNETGDDEPTPQNPTTERARTSEAAPANPSVPVVSTLAPPPPRDELHELLEEADRALAQGDHGAARAALERGATIEARGVPGAAHVRLAVANLHAGAIEDALRVLASWAHAAAPKLDASGWLARANDEPPNAPLEALLVDYATALALAPHTVEAWRELGVGLTMWGRSESALRAYALGLEAVPGDSMLLTHRGVTLMRMDRAAEALESWDRALAADPANAAAWKNRGAALVRLERPLEEALEAFTRALELQPNDARTCYSRAECERKLGRQAEAIASLKRILALPGAPAAVVEAARSALATFEALDVIDQQAEALAHRLRDRS